MSVFLVGRNPDRLEAAVAQVRMAARGAEVDGLPLDVCRRDDMQRMAAVVLERYGRIDILVACAGILRASSGRIRTVRDTEVADWDEVLAVNLKGVFLSNQAVLPAMLARRQGQIVNVASTSALRGHAFDAAYCASKFAIAGLSEALAEEVRASGIRVQTLLPGATESVIWEQNGPIPRPRNVLPVDRLVDSILYMLELPAACRHAGGDRGAAGAARYGSLAARFRSAFAAPRCGLASLSVSQWTTGYFLKVWQS